MKADVAAESTGRYVYVLKFTPTDLYPTNSSVVLDMFEVDSAGEQLVRQSTHCIRLHGTLAAEACSPHGFYP